MSLTFTLTGIGQSKNSDNFSIAVEKYKLPNGLTVVLHQDKSDPIVAVAIYYHVGSSRETEGKTGFAHLFEHMMFQESENLPRGEFVKKISNAGGTFNGSTNQDRTNYFEVLPKNYLEMALWMESDRMGYLENTVTKFNLANQQDVVMNEKRQSYDNAPYGFNQMLILKNLYPKGHPYNWDVIGSMQDLVNASIPDVKAFHHKFYTPNNAFLVISGDFEKPEAKALVEKYFGEIPSGVAIEKRKPMPVTLNSTVRLYHEDNFAKAPQLTIVFPSAERYSKDSYALSFLGRSSGKFQESSPLYTVLVKDKKLTSRVMARNMAQELAGSFTISVTANPGVNLTEVEKAIFEGLQKFEKDGFTEEDLTRIKAGFETRFYNSFSSVQGKAFTLAEYTMNTGDPEFYKKDFQNTQAVTMADIKAAYNKYIKGKNFVETSFVPKGEVKLIAEGSVNAGITEEDVTKAAEIKADTTKENIIKTKTKFDRSVMPKSGPDPEVATPLSWSASLSDGMKIWGIRQSELPLVQYSLVIEGGHLLDNVDKAGLANMVASYDE